jgi:hypothetical protein
MVVFLMAVLMVMLAGPSNAVAADKKKVTGVVLILAGGGLAAGAFNYETSCPSGYTTHTIRTNEVNDTTCVWIGQTGSDVTDPTTSATFARPGMLYSGIASAAVGTVLLLLPKKAQKAVQRGTQGLNLTVTPAGWRLTKRLAF